MKVTLSQDLGLTSLQQDKSPYLISLMKSLSLLMIKVLLTCLGQGLWLTSVRLLCGPRSTEVLDSYLLMVICVLVTSILI